MTPVMFYFDLGSPYAYLAAERLTAVLGARVLWQPVLLGGLFKLTGRSSWARGEPGRRREGMAEIERRARRYGLPPLRWPDPWPTDYLFAMRAATFAAAHGAGERFACEALRYAFAEGADLSAPEPVLEAAARAELDRSDVLEATADPVIKQRLRATTDEAHRAGVFGVPTIAIGEQLFWGDDRLDAAAEYRRRVAHN